MQNLIFASNHRSGDNNHTNRRLKRFACRLVLLVIALTLTPTVLTIWGQEQPQSIRDAAERLVDDGDKLVNEASRASLLLAIKKYEQAASLNRSVNDRHGEGVALSRIGGVYDNIGDKLTALTYFKQSLSILHGANSLASEAAVLDQIGRIYSDLGDKRSALEYYNQSLAIWQKLQFYFGEAATLSNMGLVYSDIGENEKALACFERALMFQGNNPYGAATTLNNIGRTYLRLAQFRKALEYFDESLSISRAKANPSGMAVTLTGIGLTYIHLGQSRKALDYLKEALKLRRKVHNRNGEAVTLNNIGLAYLKLKDKRKALEYFNETLAIRREVGDLKGEAVTLCNMGSLYDGSRDKERVFDSYNQSLMIFRSIGDLDGEALVLSHLMVAWRDSNVPLAILYGKQAVNSYQKLRANISGLDPSIQQGFLLAKEDTYRLLANLLISAGRLAEAQQVLRLLKEHEYSEFVRRDPTALALMKRSDLTRAEEAALKRYNLVAEQISEIAKQFSTLRASGVSPNDEAHKTLKANLEAANRSFQVLLRELAEEFGKGVVKEIRQNSALQSDLKRWENGAVSLYTLVGKDNYRVILTTPTLQVAREANPKIGAEDLNKLVLAFREIVDNPDCKLDPRPLGQVLFKILLGPVTKDLETADAKMLIWSLDGTLRYLPIAALHDGKQYVVERYQNVTITLASRTHLDLSPSKKRGLGLGASKGVVKEWGQFRPLPWVPAELRSIIREENQNALTTGVVPGRVMLDDAFTAKAMEEALGRGGYPLVHIASHFKFNPGNVSDSFLVLGDGNRLTLEELLPSAISLFDGVELITLSACETAIGGDANGVEIEGLAALGQNQGAHAVIATLWPVVDDSTMLFMQKFYQFYITKPGMLKVEALRQAQLDLLHSKTVGTSMAVNRGGAADCTRLRHLAPPFPTNPNEPFAHPHFWAPFILMGNWR